MKEKTILNLFMDKNSFTLFVSKPILLIPLIIFMTGCNPGDKDNSSDYAVLTWWVIPFMLLAGFATPLPYNYWRLKKYGVACH